MPRAPAPSGVCHVCPDYRCERDGGRVHANACHDCRVKSSVAGQSKAAEQLAALIADEDVPAAAKPGLQRAYDAVVAEHGSVAMILSRFSDRMPASIRTFVEAIVTQAHEDAQGMRENRPTPPAGQPDGTPGGQPEGTPGGAPDGTPGGRPDGS